eukprot:TRINITY_DN16733_c0_g1_i1.p1 TRINITY_DN16733_c0_g1~~TRINITY_DN16733_c0_g1_i1.p1  ORF type:complete len:796 (+),score=251.09 TRINITY_DN16733_c0_g1_i1:248-2635(+)
MYSHATSKSLSLLRKKGGEGIDPNIKLDPSIEGTSPLSSDDQIDASYLEDGTKYIELLDHKIQKLKLRNERLAEHLRARGDDPFPDSKLHNFTDEEDENDHFKHDPFSDEDDEDFELGYLRKRSQYAEDSSFGDMDQPLKNSMRSKTENRRYSNMTNSLHESDLNPRSSMNSNMNKSIDSAFLPPRNAGFDPSSYKPRSSTEVTPPKQSPQYKRPQTASHSQSTIFSSTPKTRPHSTQNTPRVRRKNYSSSSEKEEDNAWMFKYGDESPTTTSEKYSKSAYTSPDAMSSSKSARSTSPSKSIVFGKTYYRDYSAPSPTWNPQITVPQPFEFDKRPEKTTVSQQRLQMDLALKEWQPKPFKANPLPAHTKEPLYEELISSQTDRRREVKEQSYRKTREREAPFSFWKDEYAQKKQPAPSTEYPPSPPFKANPVPPTTYDDTINKKLAEKEKEREQRIKIRARELMETAALPPRMNEEFISKEKSKKKRPQSAQATFTHHPQINTSIPDYKKLQAQFQEELQQKRASFKATVPTPTNINSPTNTKTKILEDIEGDKQRLNEMRWPYLSKRTYTPPTPPPKESVVPPANITNATKLKRQVVEQKRLEQELQMKREAEEERQRRIRQKQATKKVSSRLMNDTAAKELENKERLERMKRESIGRTKEFKEYMKKMMDTLDSERLFLFERGPVDQAGRTASLKVDNTLREYGLEVDPYRGIKYTDSYKPKKKEKSKQEYTENFEKDEEEEEGVSEKEGSEKEISEELESDLDFDGSEKENNGNNTNTENENDKSNENDELS